MLIVETMILNVCDFARSSVFFHLFPLPLDSRYFYANAVVKGRRRDKHTDGLTVNGALQASLCDRGAQRRRRHSIAVLRKPADRVALSTTAPLDEPWLIRETETETGYERVPS